MPITHTVTKKTVNHIELMISVPNKLANERFEQVYQEYAPQVQVKGFRPGHAPRTMVIEQIGLGRLAEETLNRLLRQAYQESMLAEKVVPVGQPQIEIKSWQLHPDGTLEKDFEFSCSSDLMPPVELGDYTKITLPKHVKDAPEPVEQKDIDTVMSHLQRQKGTPKEVAKEHTITKGNLVTISYTGTIDGVAVEQLTNKHYPVVLGTGALIEDFEKHLIGAKAGESREFTITLSQNTPDKHLAGKLAQFSVTIEEVKELELPDLNDQFAASFGVKDLEALREQVKKNLDEERRHHHAHAIDRAVLGEAIKLMKVDLPNALIDEEVDRMIKRLADDATKHGTPFPIYLEKIGKTEAELRKEFRPQAEGNIRLGLLLGEVIKRERIDIKDEQSPRIAMQRLMEIAKRNSFAKSKTQMSNDK